MEPAAFVLLNEIMKELKEVKDQVSSMNNKPVEIKEVEHEGTMTVEELKNYLGIGTTKAYELCNMKGFPCINLGRRKVIPKKQLKEWLYQNSLEKKII